jgi:hypothetical protein
LDRRLTGRFLVVYVAAQGLDKSRVPSINHLL